MPKIVFRELFREEKALALKPLRSREANQLVLLQLISQTTLAQKQMFLGSMILIYGVCSEHEFLWGMNGSM